MDCNEAYMLFDLYQQNNVSYLKAKLRDCFNCRVTELKFYKNLGPNHQSMMNKIKSIKKKIK